jgi:hypothetical protein
MATEDYAALALKKRDEFYAKIAETHAWKNVTEEVCAHTHAHMCVQATYSVRHRKVDDLDIVLMKGTASTPADHLARMWHAKSPMLNQVDKNVDHVEVLKVIDKVSCLETARARTSCSTRSSYVMS